MSTDSHSDVDEEATAIAEAGDDRSPTASAVRTALASVTDPELDRSIVELDYVEAIDVDGATVTVAFTLPTAWCSPAFAWMMAVDARDAVESLPGVRRCVIELREHMLQEEINAGVNERRSFAESFPDAEDGIGDLRETLDEKAVLSRQYDAVETLLEAGLTLEQTARLDRSALDPVGEGELGVTAPGRGFGVVVDADPVERYLAKADELGRFEEGSRLFRTPAGDPIDPDGAEVVHRRARLASVNMDGQGGVCDALHESRQSMLAER